MYVSAEVQKPFRRAVMSVFQEPIIGSIAQAKTILALAEDALICCGHDSGLAANFCVERVLFHMTGTAMSFPQGLVEYYQNSRDAYWIKEHERFVAADHKIKSFDNDSAVSAVAENAVELGLPAFEVNHGIRNDKFQLGTRANDPNSDLTFVFRLFGRSSVAPMVDGEILVVRNERIIAEFTAARCVDCPPWRPSRKNSIASYAQLKSALREPMVIFRVFMDLMPDFSESR